MNLSGAFAAGGGGLKLSKEEKREALEIAELKTMAEPPAWASSPELLGELCSKEDVGPAQRLADAPLDCHDAIVRSRSIARLETEGGGPWYAILPPKSDDESLEAVLCLGKDDAHLVYGAIGWWPAEKLLKAGGPLRAADAVKVVRVDGAEYPSCMLGHPTVIGVGENHKAPVPASSDIDAPVPLQLCEAFRQYHVAKAQVHARLTRGGAGDEEKKFVKQVLLKEAYARLKECANSEELPVDHLNRTESAVQGLRKTLLSRDWESRCAVCGVRHSVVEKGTCKFWVAFAEGARERQAH